MQSVLRQKPQRMKQHKKLTIFTTRDEYTSFLYKPRLVKKLEMEIKETTEDMYEKLKSTIHATALDLWEWKNTKHLKTFCEQMTKQIYVVDEKERLYLILLSINDLEDSGH